MKKRDIIYGNFLSHMDRMLSEDLVSEYYNKLENTTEREQYTEIIEGLTQDLILIKKSYDNNIVHTDFNTIQKLISDLNKNFPSFPILRFHELLVHIEIIKKITSELTELDDQELSVDNFTLANVNHISYDSSYYYFHNDDRNVICLLNFSDPEKCLGFIKETSFPLLFLLKMNTLICGKDEIEKKKYIMVEKSCTTDLKCVESILYIHLISEGSFIHKAKEYKNKPNNNYRSKLIFGNKYQQFNDIIHIFSEYNNLKDIFDKYLRLYQIFENFMGRYPIVSLENLNGRIFSIRDFKVLYSKVEKSEREALSALFAEIYKIKDHNGKDYRLSLSHRWKVIASISGFQKTEIDTFLKKLKLTQDYDRVKKYNVIEIGNFFISLIYNLRNSIVHNKETEFHLTHKDLDNTTYILIADFVIPVLEDFIFKLISEYNPVIWYKNQKMILYDD